MLGPMIQHAFDGDDHWCDMGADDGDYFRPNRLGWPLFELRLLDQVVGLEFPSLPLLLSLHLDCYFLKKNFNMSM